MGLSWGVKRAVAVAFPFHARLIKHHRSEVRDPLEGSEAQRRPNDTKRQEAERDVRIGGAWDGRGRTSEAVGVTGS